MSGYAVECRGCGGTGDCAKCNGSGKKDGMLFLEEDCRRCGGTGVCPGCGGSGVVVASSPTPRQRKERKEPRR